MSWAERLFPYVLGALLRVVLVLAIPAALLGGLLVLWPIPLEAFQEEGRDASPLRLWQEPYGRYALQFDDTWPSEAMTLCNLQRDFRRPRSWQGKSNASADLSLYVRVHELRGSIESEVRHVEDTWLGRKLGPKDEITVSGRKGWTFRGVGASEYQRIHVIIPAHDYVLHLEFLYDTKDEGSLNAVISGVLRGVQIPKEKPPPVRVRRRRYGFQVGDATRDIDGAVHKAPASDPASLLTTESLPIGWSALKPSTRGLLEGLVLEKAGSGFRVYVCPLPDLAKAEADGLDPMRDMRAVFFPLEARPTPKAPALRWTIQAAEMYLGRLRDKSERQHFVWRFVLQAPRVRALVICTWEVSRKIDPSAEAGEILQALQINDDRVRSLPKGLVGEWVDWLDLLMTAEMAKKSDQIYSYVWSFHQDGSFRRISYSGNPSRETKREEGQCLYLDDRFLFLLFDDNDMEILPMERPPGRRGARKFTLDFRRLYDRAEGATIYPWADH